MFGKIWTHSGLLFFLLLTACARPNYQKVDAVVNDPDAQKIQCTYYLAKADLCLSMLWQKMPTESEYGHFDFEFSNLKREVMAVPADAQVEVILWMPSMGHGSSPVVVNSIDQKKWLASEVFFIMPGDWEIRFQLKRNEEVIDEIIVPIFI